MISSWWYSDEANLQNKKATDNTVMSLCSPFPLYTMYAGWFI